MEKTRIFYDQEYDQLLISQKQENEKVKNNFIFDDVTLSLTRRGKVVGIEIFSASRYLEEMGIDPKVLENIKSAEIIIKPKRDFIFIGFNINTNSLKNENPIRIPITNLIKNYVK